MEQQDGPNNRDLPYIRNSAAILARGQELACNASKKLCMGDLQAFQETYEALRELYREHEGLVLLAESLGAAICDLGSYRLERSDYIQLTGCMKDIRRLFERFPASASLAEHYAFLLVGILGLQSKLGDYDDWHEYDTAFRELGNRFPHLYSNVGDVPHALKDRLDGVDA